MIPTNQALQVFYGTIPLILVLVGISFKKQMLLESIREQLKNLEAISRRKEKASNG